MFNTISQDEEGFCIEGSKYQRIKFLRDFVLIHSYLYYWLNDTLVTDEFWQTKANELAELQGGEEVKIGHYDDQFKDWTGDTGYHLQYDARIRKIACDLLRVSKLSKELDEMYPLTKTSTS